MNELHIYASRFNRLMCLIGGMIATVFGLWLILPFQLHISVLLPLVCFSILYARKLLVKKLKITLSTQGIQFHQSAQPFVAWNDIQHIQLNGNQIIIAIDNHPPDYERLNDIELSNLPQREIQLAYCHQTVSGLNVSPQTLTNWLCQMQQAPQHERHALLLAFHYEQ